MSNHTHAFQEWTAAASQSGGDFVVTLTERILTEAAGADVSDVHFQPEKDGMDIRFRTDGVLHRIGLVPVERIPQIVARLKVLADLLTYKTNVPQEGRIRAGRLPSIAKEMRISTTPTIHGERVVVRFFSEERRYHYPDELGFPSDILSQLQNSIRKNSGAVVITGPAGSGKTTTAYALLRELADRGETLRSIVTLEDPVEHALDGIAQIELSSQGERTLGETIKYMMRQDPEVLFVGEIRDRQTAESAFQAALTGHLLLTTFHAGGAVETVGRLCELGIEPFVLRSGISCVLSQRLVRKLCDCAATVSEPLRLRIGQSEYELKSYKIPKGCPSCSGTGYRGRIPLTEALPLANDDVMRSLLDRNDTATLRATAICNGMIPLADRAVVLIEQGVTSPLEVRRVFG
ncbi:MAG: GspE/PulE family protein [Planctomycetaceae bacterium]|jgi:type II secretory ATPase GspE/PulE/Tfp pilus assembly ATPase PilB-like protein|nr:GspE/PulE family protein [Planctomycetaceae bacterium]